MSEWAAKRFWKSADVVQVADAFVVQLDGRSVKTPLKTPITVPTRAMADAMAAEWDAQGEKVAPMSMPVTRAVNATLDKVIPQRAEVADMLAKYGACDLLCYRATHPEALSLRQEAVWDPLLEWAKIRFGAELRTTQGVIHVTQSPDAIAALRARVHQFTPWELTAFHEFVTITGSLVIGLAAAEAAFAMDTLWQSARIDEDWQAEQWGEDDEATETANAKRADFLQAATFLALART